MKKYLVFLALLSANSFAEDVVDIKGADITTLRSHTTNHYNANARNFILLKIANLGAVCTSGVFFEEANNQATLSLVLSAKVTDSNIRLGYEPSKPSPWGSTAYCALTYFDLK